MHLIRPQEQGDDVVISACLNDCHGLWILIHHGAKMTVNVVNWARSILGDDRPSALGVWPRRVLDQGIGNVDTKAIYTQVKPEAQHALKELQNPGIPPVEIRLSGVKEVVVPLTRLAIGLDNACPTWSPEHRLPVVWG